MDKTGIIFLTSTGFSSPVVYDKFKEIAELERFKKAVIITTASFEKENNQYSQLALSQLKSMGFEICDFYDFEKNEKRDLSVYDVVYVCGGNTFKLMKFAREVNFDIEINKLLKRGGAYVGVSAGSLIVGPSIQIANEINPDKNEVGLADFSGFNIIDFTIFPHYSPELEEKIKEFEVKKNTKIERLSNSQAILVNNGNRVSVE